MSQDHNLQIVITLTMGFALASVLGYLTQRLKTSPILGYLFAGYLIGPFSPGFVGDLKTAEQLAEIGVILMMFEVGLHFNWKDLVKVRGVAIPGALGQSIIATLAGIILVWGMGWSLEAGIILGLAISVASTVILVRALTDNKLLDTTRGHIAIGWLIVEDILTVLALLLLPSLAGYVKGDALTGHGIFISIFTALAKFVLLTVFMLTVGKKIVSWLISNVARTRSHELFTLSILALIFSIAVGSTLFFSTSIALGAFIAGMVIGETDVRYEASANALPIKDAFAVLFFVTVGMLFNPSAIMNNFMLFLGMIGIILLIKPLAAFLITIFLKHTFRTALTIAIALAQIGEFSFILAEEAMNLDLLPEEGFDLLVACAIISISLNPFLFSGLERLQLFLETRNYQIPEKQLSKPVDSREAAIIVGYGPIGESASAILEEQGVNPTVIDHNIDTIIKLGELNRFAVFGDASSPRILENAGITHAKYLIITVPELETTLNIIQMAKRIKPTIIIAARANFISEEQFLKAMNVPFICGELESKKAFDKMVQSLIT